MHNLRKTKNSYYKTHQKQIISHFRYLGFLKTRNYNCSYGSERHHAKFSGNRTVAEIWRFIVFFQNAGPSLSWICYTRVGRLPPQMFEFDKMASGGKQPKSPETIDKLWLKVSMRKRIW